MRRVALAACIVLVAASCSSAPTEPGDVVEAWTGAAMVGDVEAAQSFIASNDIPWIGLGATPDAFAAGAGPYEAGNIFIECRSDHTLGRCETWWSDVWISAIPELRGLEDRGEPMLRVTAEVVEGKIVAFREWQFAPEIVRASNQHTDYLEVYEPEKLAAACGTDTAAAECSQLFVDTVGDWLDHR